MSTNLAVIDSADRADGCDNAVASMTAAAAGDTMPAGGDIYLRVTTAGTDCTVTVIAAGTVGGPRGTFLAPKAMSANGATADKTYGPFPADTFADPSDGRVHLAYSATTNVKVGVYRFTNA